jgi:hypothetical protein
MSVTTVRLRNAERKGLANATDTGSNPVGDANKNQRLSGSGESPTTLAPEIAASAKQPMRPTRYGRSSVDGTDVRAGQSIPPVSKEQTEFWERAYGAFMSFRICKALLPSPQANTSVLPGIKSSRFGWTFEAMASGAL